MTENYFTLWDANMGTVAVLNGRTMDVESDGTFTITVDSDPAGGRPNHVQSTPEAHEFYIRDVLLDWESRRSELLHGATPGRRTIQSPHEHWTSRRKPPQT